MNGECKTYRLNEPMTWHEYLEMPDDVRESYIELLRKRFNVPFQHIGVMLGVSQKTISKEILRLGLSEGRGGGHRNWDKAGFFAWCKGETAAPAEDAEEQEESILEQPAPSALSVPEEGSLSFEGPADASLDAIKILLQNTAVKLKVSWVMVDAESGAE